MNLSGPMSGPLSGPISYPIAPGQGVGAPVIPFNGVLGWGAVSTIAGVRVDDPATIGAWNTWIGVTAGQQMAFANGTAWANLISYATTEAARGASYALHWSLGLPPGVTLAQVAAGQHDANIRTVLGIMAAARLSDTRIPLRPIWEFNGFSHGWDGVSAPATFIAAFRRIAALAYSVDNRFRIEWCPGLGSSDPTALWPGDTYVDVVGTDFYLLGSFGTNMDANWRLIRNGYTWSLNTMATFARAHSKPMATTEWGIGKNNAQLYVSAMREWLTEYAAVLAWQNYYNVDNGSDFLDRLDLDAYPATGTRFKTEFGASVPANLFSNPTDFSNAAWSKVASTITSGQADPHGGTSAYAMKETAATSQHDVVQTPSKDASSHTYRVSLTYKPLGGRTFTSIQVYQNSFGDGGVSYFDNSNGNTGSTTFSYGGIGTPNNFTSPAENGFYVSGYEFTSSTGTSISAQLEAASADGTDSYAGDVTKGLYLASASLRKVA